VKKVNKKSPALREKSLALLCIILGQTAHSPALREKSPTLLCIVLGQTAHNPRHYTRNARITKIGCGTTGGGAAKRGFLFISQGSDIGCLALVSVRGHFPVQGYRAYSL
jgi:hypothetical protein